ncbi:LacI family DNA-binding transcriptional regulator [Nocardia fluminea]|uniref:LacI family DNA-binding transcriptional regulator n=1 Tax=Nocardia fluminea TaxID=134984 RepID=UPI0033E0B993
MSRPAKRPTSADVARAAGVSRTTVSFVLNDRPGQSIPEETRHRVVEAAARLDYHPHASAQALAAGRSNIVLLALPDLPIGQGITRFVEELSAALSDHGLTLVIHLMDADRRPLPDVCATVNASAVTGLEPFDHDSAEALDRAGAAVVFPRQPRNPSSIMLPLGRVQAEHLISRRHRCLGYAMPNHPNLRRMAEERLRGVTAACADAELDAPVVVETSLDIVAAAAAVRQWRERYVTGVCAYNDETALAVLAGIRELGLTAPEDLAVIGADDISTARLAYPPLTTVSFDIAGAGRRRAEAIAAALSARDPEPCPTQPTPTLIQRSST